MAGPSGSGRSRRRPATPGPNASRPRTTAGRPQLILAEAPPEAPPPGRPRRRGRRGVSSVAWLTVVPVAIIAVVLIVHANQSVRTAPPRPGPQVIASVPYWSIGTGTQAVLANRDDISEVSPWIYGVSNNQIVLDSGISKATIRAYLSRLRASGLQVLPTLANVDAQGNWTYGPIARMLHDPPMAARQVTDIVALVDANNYAGIDLDYENLRAADRQAFTAFVTSLASALHAHGRLLSVALFAKASNAGYAPRNVAQNYAAIGRAADQVRLMAYDYHWATSPPGAAAPIGWVRDVIRYAKTQIAASKIILGIPLYGYDWTAGYGTAITWPQAIGLSRQYHAPLRYSAASQSSWFTYTTASGHQHAVWFESAPSSRAKFEAAREAGIAGVYLWMYGSPDPATWPALHQLIPLTPRSAGAARRRTS